MYKKKIDKKQDTLAIVIFIASIISCFYALSATKLELWTKIFIVLIVIFINLAVQFSILFIFKQHIKHKKIETHIN